jgi:hypothetical protein
MDNASKQCFGSALIVCGSGYGSETSADPDPDPGSGKNLN